MKRKCLSFKYIYPAYVAILAIAVIAIIAYVNGLLHQYEEARPESHVEAVMEELVADAAEGDFWSQYSLPEVEAGKFEEHLDVERDYLAQYTSGNLEYAKKGGSQSEDELVYVLKNGGTVLAEIKLKAMGPAVTRLAVLNYREWQVESVQPVFGEKDYTLTVPADFQVSVNGIGLTEEDSAASDENEITYSINGLYMEPVFDITDKDGNTVNYSVNAGRVTAEFYYYTLTIPAGLTVEMNGKVVQGEELEDDRVRYDIRELAKPVIHISDYYGHTINYEGGTELPLTYMTIKADSRYKVHVNGNAVPVNAVTTKANPDYELLVDYVADLPQISICNVVVLEQDAEITVLGPDGDQIALEKGRTEYDLTTNVDDSSTVPEEISAEINVLEVAQNWSLFMSRDYPFDRLKQYFIADSYQYQVAHRYATGVDITFISSHTLKDPAFTEESVTNFAWIADNCFSVDISFVKHMILGRNGTVVEDPMNDRFYFVKYDDTNDNTDNPTWKIASMKEIVGNE